MNPSSNITLPLGVAIYYLAKVTNGNIERARLLKNKNIKVNRIYYFHKSEHNLIIHRIPANSTQQNMNSYIDALIMIGGSQGLDIETQDWREDIY